MNIKVSAIVLVLLAGVFLFVTRDRTVGSINMVPTLMKGDRVSVSIFSSFSYEPKRWDVVIYKTLSGSYAIGRIVGLPLEKIYISGGTVFVNKEPVTLPKHIKESGVQYYSTFELSKKEKDLNKTHAMGNSKYFILGDNSERSFDSRYFGGVERENIINKVEKVGT